MTDEHPGPDFHPYPLPLVVPPPPPPPVSAPPAAATSGRWSRALDTVSPLGIVSIGCGAGALVLLVLVTFLAGQPGPGAVVTLAAAVVSLVTGWVALRSMTVRDSRTLVISAQTVGALSAVLAAMVYAGSGSGDAQPVTPPSPQPSASAPAQQQPTPAPSQQVLPPGAVNGFGVPSMPGAPILDEPTALGTLQGHVVDTAGKPVKGAVVTVTRSKPGDTSETPACPTQVTTLTNAAGLYQLSLCQLGEGLGYHVRITVNGHVAESNLFVNSGNTTTYDVILPR